MSHKKNSKRKQAIKALELDLSKKPIAEAISILKQIPVTKFEQTVELIIHLGIDTKQADQQVRATANLPAGTGKSTRVAVIAEGDAAKAAEANGADKVGYLDLIEEISKGQMDFDKLLITPNLMKDIAKLGRSLGPKGLMPNPKDGTVTNNIAETVSDIKMGKQVSFRAEKDGAVVHLPVGKLSFENEKLEENIKEVIKTLHRMKPSSSKGQYFKSVYIKSTMSPAVECDIAKTIAA